MPAGPLAGVRVLDVTTTFMGPYATLLLAQRGGRADGARRQPGRDGRAGVRAQRRRGQDRGADGHRADQRRALPAVRLGRGPVRRGADAGDARGVPRARTAGRVRLLAAAGADRVRADRVAAPDPLRDGGRSPRHTRRRGRCGSRGIPSGTRPDGRSSGPRRRSGSTRQRSWPSSATRHRRSAASPTPAAPAPRRTDQGCAAGQLTAREPLVIVRARATISTPKPP
jgi:hypothetical protein